MPAGQPKTDGIALGQATAAAVLARRANDGSTVTVPYVPGSGAGVWIPTPPTSAPALLPHWRNVAPWTMTAPAQFRPGPPPALDSATYTADFIEMKAIGETNSTTRTAEQTAIGLFHIEVPPFTLGSAARYARCRASLAAHRECADVRAPQHGHGGLAHRRLGRQVPLQLLAARHGDSRRRYGWQSGDRAGPGMDSVALHAAASRYPAAHTIVAAAGATVLAGVFGDEFTFTIESPTLPGQPRTFARFSDFPVESSNARVWAGFHWRNSTVVAAQIGAAIGQQAVAKHLRNTQPPTFTKITEGDIVNDGGRSAGCAWGDYNGDGFEDLFVANNNGENDFLYRNNGDGTFTKTTSGLIVNDGGDSVSANWGDYDNDGDLDLFVSNGGGLASAKSNFLYQNNGDGTFTKIVTGSIVTDGLLTITSAWGDYDNDGWLDLFAGNYGAGKMFFTETRARALSPASPTTSWSTTWLSEIRTAAPGATMTTMAGSTCSSSMAVTLESFRPFSTGTWAVARLRRSPAAAS